MGTYAWRISSARSVSAFLSSTTLSLSHERVSHQSSVVPGAIASVLQRRVQILWRIAPKAVHLHTQQVNFSLHPVQSRRRRTRAPLESFFRSAALTASTCVCTRTTPVPSSTVENVRPTRERTTQTMRGIPTCRCSSCCLQSSNATHTPRMRTWVLGCCVGRSRTFSFKNPMATNNSQSFHALGQFADRDIA